MRFRHQKVFQTTYNSTHEVCQTSDYKHKNFEENRHMRLEMRPNFNSIFFFWTPGICWIVEDGISKTCWMISQNVIRTRD